MKSDEDAQDWIRDMLGSLDRPAIPEQVARRIDAAIAAADVPAPREPAAPPVVVPQQGRGPGAEVPSARRRSWLLGAAGVAAALVAVAMVGPFGSQPAPPAASGTAETAPPEVAPERPGPSSDENAAPQDGDAAGELTGMLLSSQTSYREQALADQVVAVSRARSAAQNPGGLPATWDDVADQPAATARGAAECVAAVPVPTEQLLYVDRAEYEGQPVLVVARQASSQVEVFVLAAGCTANDSRILLRATVEAP